MCIQAFVDHMKILEPSYTMEEAEFVFEAIGGEGVDCITQKQIFKKYLGINIG